MVVCEKPDAARRVAEALSEGSPSITLTGGVQSYSFARKGERYVVCAAQGHLYDVSDPFAERVVYPVFDVEWFPHDLVEKEAAVASRRIAAIKALAKGATRFVNACDFDAEGETIGFNVLRYGCGGAEGSALRVRFSTLTREELKEAFDRAESSTRDALASAGRARHVIDFVWGVNLSRALSQSALGAGQRYRTVSIGRVQGPTLGFLVSREVEIRTFVSRPFWAVHAEFEKERTRFSAGYSVERIYTRAEVEKIEGDCSGCEGQVEAVKRSVLSQPPPPPFNIGDLQKEAYRHFRLPPNRTMQAAERLYLDALISYPRTNSQKLPRSINYRRILQAVGSMQEYSIAGDLLNGDLKPVEGDKDDPAHPAIYPTGERPGSPLGSSEARVYDLIVRRFIAAFAPSARREAVAVTIAVDGHQFRLGSRNTLEEGWLRYYGRYAERVQAEMPALREGDRLKLVSIQHEDKFEPRPQRYNQGSLLEKMEKENIGTKATRAEIISTLVARGYVGGESLTASDLGMSVIEVMKRHAPSVLSTGLTRDVEEKLERVGNGTEDVKELIRDTIRTISRQLDELNANEGVVGRDLSSAALATGSDQDVLGACPVCKSGKLRVIRSRKTHKRFVGCTNYSKGCRASAPLPQRGAIKPANKACRTCSWPIVYVRRGRFPWRLCVNPKCPAKEAKKNAL